MPAAITATSPYPASEQVTLDSGWNALTVPQGCEAVYALNRTGADAVVTFNYSGTDVEGPVSTSSPTLVWMGNGFGQSRTLRLNDDTGSTPVDLFFFSAQP